MYEGVRTTNIVQEENGRWTIFYFLDGEEIAHLGDTDTNGVYHSEEWASRVSDAWIKDAILNDAWAVGIDRSYPIGGRPTIPYEGEIPAELIEEASKNVLPPKDYSNATQEEIMAAYSMSQMSTDYYNQLMEKFK